MSFTTCKYTGVEVSQARVQYSTCFNITFPMSVNMLVHNFPPMEFCGGIIQQVERVRESVLEEDFLYGNKPTVTGR